MTEHPIPHTGTRPSQASKSDPAETGGSTPRGRRHRRRPLPWKSPFRCAWLVVALACSVWLVVNMPSSPRTSALPAQKERVEQTETAKTTGAPDTGKPAGTAKAIGTVGMPTRAAASGEPAPKGKDEKTLSADGATASKAGTDGKFRGAHGNRGERAAHGKKDGETSALARLEKRARDFARLFLFVGFGALLGSVMEGRRWHRFLASTMGRLTRAARLPAVVGVATPTALVSTAVADSMIVASHARGEISSSALVAGGMMNSYLAHVSHSMRVLYPVVAAIGLPGLLFFGLQFAGGALVVACVLVVNRLRAKETEGTPGSSSSATVPADGPASSSTPSRPNIDEGPVLPWRTTLRNGVTRALSLLFRLACVSVPMMLAMEWCIRAGYLDFWDRVVPAAVSRHFPEQLLAIMAAQMGGLIQSSAVSASLLSQGLITRTQILLAMLVSSAVGNPVRTLRRNLPTALALFPAHLACVIVFGMQFARLLVTVGGAALVILYMSAHGA